MKRIFSPDHDLRGRWSLGDKANREKRMFSFFGNRVNIQRQAGLLEIYGKVGYAEGEKKALWDLAGHGKAYVDCGQILAKGCDKVHQHESGKVYGRYFKKNCRRKQCPTCFEGWASAQGERATIRLASFVVGSEKVESLIYDVKTEMATQQRALLHQKLVSELEILIHSGRMKLIHVVLSPPPDLISDKLNDFLRGRELAYKIGKERGLDGGASVFHPYRLKCSICGATISDYKKECSECGETSFSWFFSPHFHVVGFGWIENVKEGYIRDGWVVKNLGIRESAFWTFQYLLSHAGVSNFNIHTVTWFGKLAYNMLLHVPVLGAIRELCPLCRAPLMPLVWIGGADRPPPEPQYDKKNPILNDFSAEPSDWRCV